MAYVTQGALALARTIESTLLKSDIRPNQVVDLCNEAKELRVYGVCVPSRFVALAKQTLANSGVRVTAVVGFPLGHQLSEVKAFETKRCIELGADEIDMVLPLGDLKSGAMTQVFQDIQGIVNCAEGRPVKVILETHLLTESEKIAAITACRQAGAQFIKTSTGLTGGGATVAEIEFLAKHSQPDMRIKASGGIRTRAQAQELVDAGASRLGTSNARAILLDLEATREY
jgi:deoxyribose-phosphate aldolase